MLPINIPDRLDRFPQDPKAGTGFHDSVSTADEPLQTDSTMNLEEPSNSEDRADDLLTKDEPADHLNDVQPGQINRNDSPKLSIQSIFRRLSPLLPEQLNSLIDILEIDRNGDRRRVRTKLKNILGTLILVYNATIGEVTVSTKRQILGEILPNLGGDRRIANTAIRKKGVLSSSTSVQEGHEFLHASAWIC